MNETNAYPFSRGQFTCDCGALFYAEREKVSFSKGVFLAPCPECSEDAFETAQMRNLHRTIGSSKGAAVSPEGRAKNRLNSFTTGSSSVLPWYQSRIPMPPAKPGKYAECDDCQDINDCEANVAEKRGTSIPVYCHRKIEVSQKYAAAFLAGDPEKMKLIAADNAARMQQLFNASIKAIFDRGVELVMNKLSWDKNGNIQKGVDGAPFVIEEVYAHPLIKRCIELMQVMGFTLADWTMTPKSKEAKEQVAGFLAGFGAGSSKSAEAVSEELKSAINNFASLIGKASTLRSEDKTLTAFEAESGQREGDVKE